MRIAIGSDHGGYLYKEHIKKYLEKSGQAVVDLGCFSQESVDYPDYGFAVGEAVAKGEADRGIVVCTTGIGIGIAANKVPGVRCATCTSPYTAHMSRQHNDANVLSIGAKTVSQDALGPIIDEFLQTAFEGGGRHERRVQKINQYCYKE